MHEAWTAAAGGTGRAGRTPPPDPDRAGQPAATTTRPSSTSTASDYVDVLRGYAATQRKNGAAVRRRGAPPRRGPLALRRLRPQRGLQPLDVQRQRHLRPDRHPAAARRHGADPAAGAGRWDYFAVENMPYHGRNLTVVWDRDGSRYGQGAGLRVYVDGELAHQQPTLGEGHGHRRRRRSRRRAGAGEHRRQRGRDGLSAATRVLHLVTGDTSAERDRRQVCPPRRALDPVDDLGQSPNAVRLALGRPRRGDAGVGRAGRTSTTTAEGCVPGFLRPAAATGRRDLAGRARTAPRAGRCRRPCGEPDPGRSAGHHRPAAGGDLPGRWRGGGHHRAAGVAAAGSRAVGGLPRPGRRRDPGRRRSDRDPADPGHRGQARPQSPGVARGPAGLDRPRGHPDGKRQPVGRADLRHDLADHRAGRRRSERWPAGAGPGHDRCRGERGGRAGPVRLRPGGLPGHRLGRRLQHRPHRVIPDRSARRRTNRHPPCRWPTAR